MKKIKEVSSDENEEIYYVVGDVTELGALRAILKYMRECGSDEEYYPKLGDLEKKNFRYSETGEHKGWYWWGKPQGKTIPAGKGWIYEIS